MSGSYDRPPGGPPGRPPQRPGGGPTLGFDPYDDVVTGAPTGPAELRRPALPPQPGAPRQLVPPTGPSGAPGPGLGQPHLQPQLMPPMHAPPRQPPAQAQTPPPAAGPDLALQGAHQSAPRLEGQRRDMYAPARTKKTDAEQLKAPIVPPGSVTGRSLTLVISIMCFLACLTAGAVYMMHRSADAWLLDIASEVTVQIEPKFNADNEKTVNEVATFLQSQTGIRAARALPASETASLLEPWLGTSDALKTLPVPRLIALELDIVSPPDIEALRGILLKQYPKGVVLDDHRQWQRQIRSVTRSFSLGGLAILLLVGAATTAIIVSATRSALASNREIVEVLHVVGATDRFIAREFEKHFLRLGVRAGLVGALSAMAVFFVLPTAMELLGGGVTMAELHRLIGTGSLDPAGYVVLGMLVVVVAALCMLTSRFGVYRILNSKP